MRKKQLSANYQWDDIDAGPEQRLLNKGYEEMADQMAQDLAIGQYVRAHIGIDYENAQRLIENVLTHSDSTDFIVAVKYALLENKGTAVLSLMPHMLPDWWC